MTTKVIVQSPTPNHQDVLVRVLNPTTREQYGPDRRLREGEQAEFYVHGGAELSVTEVPKEPS